jgi:membrane complex biogenesis BtpA family protein
LIERINKMDIGNGKKTIIGMVHCLASPTTMNFNGDVQKIIDQAVKDAETLERAGVDAIIVENMGDEPFGVTLNTMQRMMLASVAGVVKSKVNIPVGIDAAFNDYEAALSIAKAMNGDFVRLPVFCDVVQYYGGVINPCCVEALRYREEIGARHIKIFADIQVKHTKLVFETTIEESAKNAVAAGADALIVTGAAIGTETPLDSIKKVKDVVKVPVFAGSGVNAVNVAQQMEIADGAIVGSSLKEKGALENLISYDLTKELIDALHGKVNE